MERRWFIGVDPGKSGAIAIVSDSGSPVGSIKFTETAHDVDQFLKDARTCVSLAVLERIGPFPGNSARSTWICAKFYGIAIGLLVANQIPFELVTPATWQRSLGLIRPKMTRPEKKRINKSRAQELFPSVKMTHANSDAFLLAEFARKSRSG